MHGQRDETFLRNADLRLCRLRFWSDYLGVGFHLTERFPPPHLICLVDSNSPAAAGGLKIRDVLLAINDKNVANMDYKQVTTILKETLKKNAINRVKLLVVAQKAYRILQQNKITIDSSFATVMDAPIQMPDDYRQFRKYHPRTCYIQLQPTDRNFGFDVVRGEYYIGIYVQDVTLDSPAYRAGLRKCDRIIKINDKDVNECHTRTIYEKLNAALMKRNVKLFVMDTGTYKKYQANELDENMSDSGGNSSQKKATLFSLTAEHDKRSASSSESGQQASSVNLDSGYEECEIDIYVYESPEEDEGDDDDPYVDSVSVSSSSNTSQMKRFFDAEYESLTVLPPVKDYENMPLISLQKSVEDLEKFVPNIKRNTLIAIQKCTHPCEGLTKDESSSLQLYLMDWHPSNQSLSINLNHALRARNREEVIPYFSYLKLILTALSKLPSLQTIVWHAARTDVRKQYPIGKVFVWYGFSSCVESDKHLSDKSVKTLFHIECQTGKSLRSHTHPKHLNEILLLPSTQFEVINHEMSNDNHRTIIYLKEIPQQHISLQTPLDADYSVVSLENEQLQKFLEQHKTDSSISFSEHVHTVADLHLIITALNSNRSWMQVAFHGIQFTEVPVKNLIQALQSNSRVTFLELRTCQLDDDISTLIASALKTNKSLQKLDLTDNKITNIGAQSFAEMLQVNSALRSLHLSSNAIGDHGVIALFSTLQQNQKLRSLHLDRTNCTYHAINQARKTNLTILHLNENQFDDKAITAVVRFLEKNRQLCSLHLARNKITSVGVKEIAHILQQPGYSLEILNINDNPLEDVGVASIVQALTKNTRLIQVHLDSVAMTINGLHEIIRMIRLNKKLKLLSLKRNAIDDDGMFLFLDGLKFNPVLTHIYLQDNQLTDECIEHVTNMMENKQIVRRFYLRDQPPAVKTRTNV